VNAVSERPPQNESELIEFVRSIDVRAPDSLHRQVDSLIASAAPGRRRLSPRRSSGRARWLAAGALAAVVLAVAIVVSVGGSTAPTLNLGRASALTLSAATAPAPTQSHGDSTELAAAVDDINFPYWEDRFGWRSTGLRSDRVGGRTVTTVFYADRHGHRIGYAIVAGSPAPAVHGGVIAWRGGTPYRELVVNGVPAVTWLRDGHLCVVSGRGVDSATLLTLASWDAHGAVAS